MSPDQIRRYVERLLKEQTFVEMNAGQREMLADWLGTRLFKEQYE